MINKFCKKPLWECSKTLSAVAQGLAPAETVIDRRRVGARYGGVARRRIRVRGEKRPGRTAHRR